MSRNGGKGTLILAVIIAIAGLGLAGINFFNIDSISKTISSSDSVPLTRVYRDSPYDLNVDTWWIVDFTAITNDTGDYFDLKNDKYFAPKDGYYHIEGNIAYTNVATGAQFYLDIMINDILESRTMVHSSETSPNMVTAGASDIRYLYEGDTVHLRTRHSGAAQETVHGTADCYTFLAVFYLRS